MGPGMEHRTTIAEPRILRASDGSGRGIGRFEFVALMAALMSLGRGPGEWLVDE